MDKETLSNYGWIVVCVLVLATLIALASPFGSFIAQGFKATTAGFGFVNQNALNSVGIDTGELSFPAEPASCGIEGHYIGDDKGEHGVAPTECNNNHKFSCECEGWVIPEGGTYYVGVTAYGYGDYSGATKIYNAGEELPCGFIPKQQDYYVDNDYEYKCYGNYWYVITNDKSKTAYGKIYNDICGVPITNMSATFINCTNLLIAPAIPSSVTMMEATFQGCSSLTTAPILPNGVYSLRFAFADCNALLTYAGNKDGDGDFSNYIIPSNVNDMFAAFNNCREITHAPILPDKVTNIACAFARCTKLTTAPTIPSKVNIIYSAFANCTSLTGTIQINTTQNMSTSSYSDCFDSVDFKKQNLTLTGYNDSLIDNLGNTGVNYDTKCNGVCQGPENHVVICPDCNGPCTGNCI